MTVIPADRLEETALWKALEGSQANEGLPGLSHSVKRACDSASERMKLMMRYAPEYTLHDECHLLRVVDLMGRILGETLRDLNAVEATLLILAAYYHDQGMVPEKQEFSRLKDSDTFRLRRAKWLNEHPNYSQFENEVLSTSVSPEERRRLRERLAELDQGILVAYLRETHAERSAHIAETVLQDDRGLKVSATSLAPYVALLCSSHATSVELITPANGYSYDEAIRTHVVNLHFIALVLRLADIMDFDRERTPDVLYRSMHFADPTSLMHWETHRCVRGWSIAEDEIRFTIRCSHPVYEKAARQYMDAIDRELRMCLASCESRPSRFNALRLRLPSHVKRDRIGPEGSSYRYHDLSFELSRDEVVELLMGEELYGSKFLCVRELLQNSLDALRLRRALHVSAGARCENGRVELAHYEDENGYEVLECDDNGIGMDESVVTDYLTKVGRSYYRSPEFESELARLTERGAGFCPCSSFGIGFMSCFMVGDRILIRTRKDYGPERGHGDPLEIEINGLGGLLVIRDGNPDQPVGTKVTITSRQRPPFLDEFSDDIRLTDVVRGFALATEFPIAARCGIPNLEDEVAIPVEPEPPPTALEEEGISNLLTLTQSFSELDENLRGAVAESFLVDESDLPALSNDQGAFEPTSSKRTSEWLFTVKGSKHPQRMRSYGTAQVAADGILVAGPPGRGSEYKRVSRRLGERSSQIYACTSVLVDARGEMRPELSPSRTAPDSTWHILRRPPGWQRLENVVQEAAGRLWEKLAELLQDTPDRTRFWRLCSVYEPDLCGMRHQQALDLLWIPISAPDGTSSWRRLGELGALRMVESGERSFEFVDADSLSVSPPLDLAAWESQGTRWPQLKWWMNEIVALTSVAVLEKDQIVFRPSPPSEVGSTLIHRRLRTWHGPVHRFDVPFTGSLSRAVSARLPFSVANASHALVGLAQQSRASRRTSPIEQFAMSITGIAAESRRPKANSRDDPVSRFEKRAGHMHAHLAWNEIAHSLHPPYTYWTPSGWAEIDEDLLDYWREAPLQEEQEPSA